MLESDAYIWIGSMVLRDDLFYIFSKIPIKIRNETNLHIVYEFYEPEIFTQLFPSWNSRTRLHLCAEVVHPMDQMLESLEEVKENSNDSDQESHEESQISEQSVDEENRQTAVMQQIEKETEEHRRIFPVEYWKKIFSSYS